MLSFQLAMIDAVDNGLDIRDDCVSDLQLWYCQEHAEQGEWQQMETQLPGLLQKRIWAFRYTKNTSCGFGCMKTSIAN